MQISDKLGGRADPEFREPGIDAEGDRAKPSTGDIGNGTEVPRNKSAAHASGVPSGSPGSSPNETNSKQSEVDESEMLERGRNPSQRSPAIKPGDDGQVELPDQLRSPIGSQTQEQVGWQAAHSGRSTSGDECEEPGKTQVRVIDADNSLNERAETDRDGETPVAVSSALSDHGADTATVKKKSDTPNAANGTNEEPPSPGSAHQEQLAREEAGKLIHVMKADTPESAVPKTGIADQPELAPPVQEDCSEKSERVSKPEQHNLESSHGATEIASSLKSPAANSSGSAEQAAAICEDASADLQQEGSRSEQADEQSGSEVPAVEWDPFGNKASDNVAVHSDVSHDQRVDAVSARIAQRDDEEVGGALEDLTEDDDFAAIQSPGASVEATDEDDQRVSADFGSHASPSADARNSEVRKQTPILREPVRAQAGDNSRLGRRIAARILAAGTLASACIFASDQLGATAWLIESAQRIQARYSLPLPNSSVQPSDDLESSIEFIGDGEGRAVAFDSDGNRKTADDLGPALRVDEGIGSAPAVDRLIGNPDRSAEYLEMPDGEAALISPAARSNSERTDASILESSKIDDGRNAPSEIQLSGRASGTATIKTASELASAGTANPEDARALKLDAAVVERNVYDATQLPAASASSSSVARLLDVEASSETVDDIEEDSDSLLKVGTLQNGSANEMPMPPMESEQQDSLSRDNQDSPSEHSASPLSNNIASPRLIPDASGEPANSAVNSSIFDKRDEPNSADLNSLRSELESEFAEIHSRFDLMTARFDLLFAGYESRSALLDEPKDSGGPLFERHDDTNVASEMNCRHSTDHSDQSCEDRLRAGKGSRPYLIATAQNAAGGEFVMPEQGYGVVLDVLKDGAGGWLIVMENATLRLD